MSTDLLQARAKAFPLILAGAVVLFGANKYFPSWFAPKDDGFGVRVVTWQGFAVVALGVGLLVIGLRRARRQR